MVLVGFVGMFTISLLLLIYVCAFLCLTRLASTRPKVGLADIPIAEGPEGAAGKAIRLPTHYQKQCIWILVEGHSASRLCAAVCSFGSAGQGGEQVDQSPHGRDGHAPLFRCKRSAYLKRHFPDAELTK